MSEVGAFGEHHALPTDHRWPRVQGVTLLGDAAHVTAPNGEGANLAMLDGAELGTPLASNPDHVEDSLADYERAMFSRSLDAAIDGAGCYEMLFGVDPARSMVEMFSQGQR